MDTTTGRAPPSHEPWWDAAFLTWLVVYDLTNSTKCMYRRSRNRSSDTALRMSGLHTHTDVCRGVVDAGERAAGGGGGRHNQRVDERWVRLECHRECM